MSEEKADLAEAGEQTDRIPVRLNLLIVAAQLLAIGGSLYAALKVRSNLELAGLTVGFAILMNSVYAIIHEAEHGILLRNRFWNNVAGACMALFFPAPFHLIRQGHIGHHMRNRSDDEAFDFYFAGDNPVWKWMQLYGVLTGLFWVTIVFSNLVVLFVPSVLTRR
ncbi:MAG TPA: fatty acid desaturase, partial [Candidatus Saccharimonadales bacterium]|nr:fatty acid desaturase [Candidatus Saccharimonadales bacterium]